MKAAAKGQNGCVKLLIEKGVDVNAFEDRKEEDSKVPAKTALMIAVSNGKFDCVKSLLEAKADMEAVDSEGKTALVYAVLRDRK